MIPIAGELRIRWYTQPGGETVAHVSFEGRTLRVCGAPPGRRKTSQRDSFDVSAEEAKREAIGVLKDWITHERRFGVDGPRRR